MASTPSAISKDFDFGSDNILCSYEEDSTNHDASSNGTHIHPSKDFHTSKRGVTLACSSPEDSLSQDVTATVERSMKTYADNIIRFLEGISLRLSQLELYCYNLDKSIGEMRSELTSDHEEADSKLKSLDKHLQEVHRSVQILRDKQELAETQKEIAKLQLVKKEAYSSINPQSNEGRSSPSAIDQQRTDNASDPRSLQLALALPHQVAPRQQLVAPASQDPVPNMTQATRQPRYYTVATPLPNPPAVSQLLHNQYLPSDPPYQNPPQTSSQVTQAPLVPQFSQYQQPQQQQQQWPQQLPQQVQLPQPPSMQSQTRPPSTNVYSAYPASQSTNPPPTETLSNSMSMQMPYSVSGRDAVPYGYGGTGRTVPQQPLPQQYPAQPGEVFVSGGSPAPLPPASAYMVREGEGSRTLYPSQTSHYAQAGYPPTSASLQNLVPHNLMVRNPIQSQFIRSHPYNELIEKLVNMGFRGDHVANVIQRMEETGQPIDFNSVHDRLNAHTSLGPQRGWSG